MEYHPNVCKICQIPTKNLCTLCKQVAYCNQDHQKEDWKNHKIHCKPFQVKSDPEMGRYLEATSNIKTGQCLFTESPLVVGPRPEEIVCLGCYGTAPTQRCPKCLWPACSPHCPGLKDLDHHGFECSILQLFARKVSVIPQDFFKYEAILPLRCLLLQSRNPKGWNVILEKEGHSNNRGPETEVYKSVQENVVDFLEKNFFTLLTHEENESMKQSDVRNLLVKRSADILHKICGIIDINALEIQLPKGGAIHALYPTASIIEHDCLPNTKHVFQYPPSNNFNIKFFANQNIMRGSHISTMYTHALWGTQQRQDHLRSNKYFSCRCKRCQDPTELGTNLSGIRCLAPTYEGKICGGTQLPVNPLDSTTLWKCDKCPTSLTSSQAMALVNMIGDEVDRVQKQKPTVESLKVLLEKLKKLLHENHYHCYSVMHSLVQLYGRQPGYLPHQLTNQTVNKKIKMCKQLLSITQIIDPTFSRLYLYSAVLQQELASAIFLLAKRKMWTGPVLADKMKEAKQLLLNAKVSLAFEEPGSAGSKMTQIICNSLEEIDGFCRSSNVISS